MGTDVRVCACLIVCVCVSWGSARSGLHASVEVLATCRRASPMPGSLLPPTVTAVAPADRLPPVRACTQCVDATIILQNDQLAEICRRRLGVSRASFRDMNSVIADQLACHLLPASRVAGQASLWEAGGVADSEARCPLGEAVTDAVPLPVRVVRSIGQRSPIPRLTRHLLRTVTSPARRQAHAAGAARSQGVHHTRLAIARAAAAANARHRRPRGRAVELPCSTRGRPPRRHRRAALPGCLRHTARSRCGVDRPLCVRHARSVRGQRRACGMSAAVQLRLTGAAQVSCRCLLGQFGVARVASPVSQ